MRLAIIKSSLHGRSDTRGVHRINAVQIETHVKIVDPVGDLLECLLHHSMHADLVDILHRENVDTILDQILSFDLIKIPKSDDRDILRVDLPERSADVQKLSWSKARADCQRHPVNISGWRARGGIEVPMSIDPEKADLFFSLPCMSGQTSDRSYSDRMISADHEWKMF